MKMAKSVEEYIDTHTYRREELEGLRRILKSLPYKECLKWGMPTYTVDGKNVVSIGSFKNWSCLWFHQGSFLKDAAGVLENAQEGKTKGMRQWRFRNADEIDKPLVREYLVEAMENQKAGKEIAFAKKDAALVIVPMLLREHLDHNLNHLKTFQSFTVSQRNEFSNYIIDAKRQKTKLDRLEKIKELLENGKKLSSLWSGG